MEITEERLEEFFSFMAPLLDERQRRLMAGALANILGVVVRRWSPGRQG